MRSLPWVMGLAATLLIALSCLFGCASPAAICARAGGAYTEGTCTRSGPDQAFIRQWCQEHGAVYLAGPNTCAYGEGR